MSKTSEFLSRFLLMVRSNIKVVFGNKFIYFLLGALGFFLFLLIVNLFSDNILDEELCFNIMLSPALILIFYPTTFALQNDDDTKTLEMIFGVPNYRYKVYLFRFAMIGVITFCMLLVFGGLNYLALLSFNVWAMALQLMFPVIFCGALSFMLASMLKSGTSTAVIAIIVGLGLWILGNVLGDSSSWNLFFNPFQNTDISELRFKELLMRNRIYISIGIVSFLLTTLFQLQKRERLI